MDGVFFWKLEVNAISWQKKKKPSEIIVMLQRAVKQHFWSLDETMQKVPPKLIIQVWDNDKFSADDFIGNLEINLTSIPRPAKRPRDCSLKVLQDDSGRARSSTPFRRRKQKCISLFTQRNMRGWWPCIVFEKDKPRVSGKIEMSLELLTDLEADELPAGRGREEPNANPFLKPPERPETSFLWFTAPLKSIHFIIWQKSKWKILILICILLVIWLFIDFIYAAPGYLAMKLVNPMKLRGPSWSKQSPNNNINTSFQITWTTSEIIQTVSKVSLPPASPKKGPPGAPKKRPPEAPKKRPPAVPKKKLLGAPKKGPPRAPKKGPPGIPKKGPPGAPKKGPPGVPKKGPPGIPKKGPPGAPKKGPPGAPKKKPPAVPKKVSTTALKKMLSATPSKVPTTMLKKGPPPTLKKVKPTTLKKVSPPTSKKPSPKKTSKATVPKPPQPTTKKLWPTSPKKKTSSPQKISNS